MVRSIDKFFFRTSSKSYNCLDFVREVWKELTGDDIVERLTMLQGRFSERHVGTGLRQFVKLDSPVSPCIVAFQRVRLTPHVGIYLDGKVLHLCDRGVEYQPMNVVKSYFRRINYYV